MGALSGVRTAGRVVRYIAARALGDPIRDGRLRENPAYPWPRGLRPIIVATGGLFVVLAGLAATAGPLRNVTLLADGTTSLPWLVVPVLCIAVAMALALLYAAALHLWWVVRVPLLLLVVLSLAAAPVTEDTLRGVNLVGIAVLMLLALVRWRARFAFWEFLVALAVIGHSILLQLAGPRLIGHGIDVWPLHVVTYWTNLLTILAVPAALLASAAMTELVVTTGSWSARGVWEGVRRRPRGRLIGGLLLAGLAVWAAATEVWAVATDPRRSVATLPVAVLVLGVVAVAAWLVMRWSLARPTGTRSKGSRTPAERGMPVDPDDVAAAYSPISWPLAFLLAGWAFYPVLLMLVLTVAGRRSVDSDPGTVVMALLYAAGGLAIAVGEARHGRRGQALIATVLAVSTPFAQLLLLAGWSTATDQLVTVEVAAAVLILGWLLARRRLTADRAVALGTVLLLSRVHHFREVLDDPLSALLALSGTSAVLLVGLVWRQLTEYAAARGHSDRFPNPARVMLALANMTLVTLSVATFALSAGNAGIVSLEIIGDIGDSELGGALLHASMLSGLLLGAFGRGDDVGGRTPEPRRAIESDPHHMTGGESS